MKLVLYLFLILAVSIIPILIKIHFKKELIVKQKIINISFIITIILILLLIITFWFESNNIFWNGFNSLTKLAIITSISASIYFIISNRNNYIFGTLLVPLIFITFITFMYNSSYNNIVLYDTDEFRLEKFSGGFMYRCCPYPTLFIKNGLIEKKYFKHNSDFDFEMISKKDIKTIELNSFQDGYCVRFNLKNGNSFEEDYILLK